MTDENSQATNQQTGTTDQAISTDELTLALAKADEMTNVAKQALADLSNYRKRVEEEKKSIFQFANMKLLLELLSTIDNFDRALSSVTEEIAKSDWYKGIQGIDQQLHALLDRYKVNPIISVGQKLDPSKHEALMQAPGEKDIILEEFEKGYMIEDRVLRVAKVKVGNGDGITSN